MVPGAIAGLLPFELLRQLGASWSARWTARRRSASKHSSALLTAGRRGLTEHLQTLLVMGDDDDEGSLFLDDDRVRIDWPGAGTSPYYERANRMVGETASVGGGTFMHNPIWSRLMRHSLITVHPLGGCVMAERAEEGVVDDRGRVFGRDGVGRPRRVAGVGRLDRSPAARREPASHDLSPGRACRRRTRGGQRLDGLRRPRPARRTRRSAAPGADTTRASIHRAHGRLLGPHCRRRDRDLAEYERASDAGAASGSRLAFELTLSTDDLRAEIADLARPMVAVGTVDAPALSAEPLTVESGQFQLMVGVDRNLGGVGHMWYRLPLAATDGRRFDLTGFKTVARGWARRRLAGHDDALCDAPPRRPPRARCSVGGCSGSAPRTSPSNYGRWP